MTNPQDAILLTVFLKHDQSRPLTELVKQQQAQGFWKSFPPEGIEVISWVVAMGIGQVVTLRVPPARLREVNVALEKTAWGVFETAFYPTYDFMPIWQEQRAKAMEEGGGHG